MGWVFVEPNDVWIFRDGHPFNAGEGHRAESLFPPSPLTIQGAFRAAVVARSNVRPSDYHAQESDAAKMLGALIGYPTKHQPEPLGQFECIGPFLGWRDDNDTYYRYFPLPADIVVLKDGSLGTLSFDPKHQSYVSNSNGLHTPFSINEQIDYKANREFQLSKAGIDAYLDGDEIPLSEIAQNDEFYLVENRVGIAINSQTGTVDPGKLYDAGFNRLHAGAGLILWLPDVLFSDPDYGLPDSGIIGFGGEGRSAYYWRIPEDVWNPTRYWVSSKSTHLKIVFLTPTYFLKDLFSVDWTGFFEGGKAQLVGAALHTPIQLGGWDIAKHTPRPMYTYLAPGSVLYFQADTAITAKPIITHRPDDLPDISKFGFGLLAVGEW